MRNNLGRDFSRLVRSGTQPDPRAPWWLNWLLQAGITIAVIAGLATLADWVWPQVTGRPLGAWCWLLGLLPFGWRPPIGMIIMLIGFGLALTSSRRAAGITWLIIGSLVYVAPEILFSEGVFTTCAAGSSPL